MWEEIILKKSFKSLFLFSFVVVLVFNGLMGSSQILASENNGQAVANNLLDNRKGNTDLVNLQLLSSTDFHGYLQALNDKSNGQIMTTNGPLTVGGAAYMATHLKNLKAGQDNSILFSVGDAFSGWPFEVASHQNEPTIEFLNAIGLDFSVAGNHEFDVSKDFLTKHMM